MNSQSWPKETKRAKFEVRVGPGNKEPVFITFTRSKTGLRIITASCKADKTAISLTTKKYVTPQEIAYRLQSRLWWKVKSIEHGKRLAAALSNVISQFKYVDRFQQRHQPKMSRKLKPADTSGPGRPWG